MAPKLSIACFTYRHERFVIEALEGFLAQRTDFAVEIVVGDDGSDDDTQAILRDYQQRFPDKIRLMVWEKNRGAIHNFIAVYHACRGEYLALCEGDDYWTDPRKLQKQAEFLDENLAYSACFHNAEVRFDDGSRPHYPLNVGQKPVVTLDDLVGERETWFVATASLVLRRAALPRLPYWLHESKSGDIPLLILLARSGPIGYLDAVMSVYRKHAGGQSNTDHRWQAGFLLNRINMYERLDAATGHRYRDRFRKTMAEFIWHLPDTVEYRHRFWPRLRYTLRARRYDPARYALPWRALLREKILPGRWVQAARKWRGTGG